MALEDLLEQSAPAPAPAPAAEPVVSESAQPTPVPQSADNGTPTPDPDMFPREYVEQLRREAADWRTKYSPFKDVFSDADDEVREYVLDLSRQLINSPLEALDELESLAAQLREARGKLPGQEPAAPPAEGKPNPLTDKAQPLTRADWERIRDEEREAEANAAALADLRNKVHGELGYPQVSEDKYGDVASLLSIASRLPDGDLAKAHQLRVDRFNEAVEAAVVARMEEIRAGKAKWPSVASTGTSPISPATPPKTVAEAGRAAREYINRLYEQG